MNEQDLWNSEDSLHALLRRWRLDTPLPHGFQGSVWRRIALAEARAEASLWQSFSDWVQTMFRRPRMAVAYLALFMVTGLTVGHVQAQRESLQAASRWRTLYVQSVDPYQAPRN